jgi:hypothetical protein
MPGRYRRMNVLSPGIGSDPVFIISAHARADIMKTDIMFKAMTPFHSLCSIASSSIRGSSMSEHRGVSGGTRQPKMSDAEGTGD